MITPNKARSSVYSLIEEEKICRLCNTSAICNKFTCYKQKQGKVDCNNCDERLCQHHWRIFFRNNI